MMYATNALLASQGITSYPTPPTDHCSLFTYHLSLITLHSSPANSLTLSHGGTLASSAMMLRSS